MTASLTHGPDYNATSQIAQALRQRDKDELYALAWEEDPFDLARRTAAMGEFQWIARWRSTPVASIGAVPVWPGVWTVWAYGTDEWPRVVRLLTRHVRRFMIPALMNAGAHRAHCYALRDNEDACRWLGYLGARMDAVLDNFGKNGQTFVIYSWRRDTTE